MASHDAIRAHELTSSPAVTYRATRCEALSRAVALRAYLLGASTAKAFRELHSFSRTDSDSVHNGVPVN